MCDPITMGIASIGLGIAQTVGQFAQAQQAADNQDLMYAKNKANAEAAFSSEQNAIQQRMVQEQDASAQRSYDMNEEYVATRESAENQAANYGMAGLSVEGLLGDIDRQEATRQERNEQNLEWTLEELQANQEQSGSNLVSRVNSVEKGVRPSGWNLALGILGSGMSGVSSYNNTKAQQSRMQG